MLLLMVAYSNSEMTWLRTKKPIKKKKKKTFSERLSITDSFLF